MRDLRGADNRRGHRLLLQQPGQRDVYARRPVLLGNLATRSTTWRSVSAVASYLIFAIWSVSARSELSADQSRVRLPAASGL
jgi:hypothetical protein